jgi:GNAT superfamily N-acetyltransferase
LAIDGAHARLVDVNVYRRKARWTWWPPDYYRGVDYRGIGVGTRLLETVIVICEEQGVIRLMGEMHGEIERLTTWYQRHGFEVGAGFAIQREIQR